MKIGLLEVLKEKLLSKITRHGNERAREKLFFVAVLLAAQFLFGYFFAGKHGDDLVVEVVFTAAPLYWWCVPFLLKVNMELPTWGAPLEPGKHKWQRLIFFCVALLMYLIALFINPQKS